MKRSQFIKTLLVVPAAFIGIKAIKKHIVEIPQSAVTGGAEIGFPKARLVHPIHSELVYDSEIYYVNKVTYNGISTEIEATRKHNPDFNDCKKIEFTV